ncbi:MAG: hypothetical protein J1F23_01980 [Oscillospiraceae bacterium]|nr:hypothetical protein [Oscillospiraceae bacterium]
MDIDVEKLKYLLNDMEDHIGNLIDHVLSDSETDPHYSAVSTTNKIKCYIQIMTELGEKMPYRNVEEFFDFNAYTKDEYNAFEISRQKESAYYRDVQF